MMHGSSLFLSALVGGALLVGLAPGCGGGSGSPATVGIMNWDIQPGDSGSNGPSVCGAGAGVEFQIGNPEANPIVTVNTGTNTSNGVGVTVACTVSPDTGGFNVNASVAYGQLGTMVISGQFNDSGNGTPPDATGIHAQFTANFPGFIATLNDSSCTVSFTKNSHMGIAATRIWGFIDCPNANDPNHGTTCDASAEFLFENCGQ
jgi:hypothetical protein